jgi:hypothetical protein
MRALVLLTACVGIVLSITTLLFGIHAQLCTLSGCVSAWLGGVVFLASCTGLFVILCDGATLGGEE